MRLAVAEPPDGGQGVQVVLAGVLVLVADLCLQQVFERRLVDAEVLLVPGGGAHVDPERAKVPLDRVHEHLDVAWAKAFAHEVLLHPAQRQRCAAVGVP